MSINDNEQKPKTVDDDYMLTTVDNPFNPFTEFEQWFKYDSLVLGYNTCSLLAITANVNDIASDNVREKEIDEAMNEICSKNPILYKKVLRKDFSNGRTRAKAE